MYAQINLLKLKNTFITDKTILSIMQNIMSTKYVRYVLMF